ncbi:hypothetical protein D3C76_1398460 [compost metagenome]
MHLVEYYHLAGQSKGAHETVLHIHAGHQCLVDGPNAERRQKAALSVVKPRTTWFAFLAHLQVLHQPSFAMQKMSALCAARYQDPLEELREPVMDLVGCQLCGKAEVNSGGLP